MTLRWRRLNRLCGWVIHWWQMTVNPSPVIIIIIMSRWWSGSSISSCMEWNRIKWYEFNCGIFSQSTNANPLEYVFIKGYRFMTRWRWIRLAWSSLNWIAVSLEMKHIYENFWTWMQIYDDSLSSTEQWIFLTLRVMTIMLLVMAGAGWCRGWGWMLMRCGWYAKKKIQWERQNSVFLFNFFEKVTAVTDYVLFLFCFLLFFSYTFQCPSNIKFKKIAINVLL